jgi:hypothetical protein
MINGLNKKTLSVIAYALLDAKKKWRAISENNKLSDSEVTDALEYLVLLDIAFNHIRISYEKLREGTKAMPFDERFPDPD